MRFYFNTKMFISLKIANLKNMKARIRRSSLSDLLVGVGSVLNVFPAHSDVNFNKVCASDSQVLKSDWKSIGGDFDTAIKKGRKKS